MSVAVEIAQKIADELNAKEFDLAFMAERGYLPRFDLEEMDDRIYVTVVPGGDTQASLSRKNDQYDFVTEIGVQCRFPGQGMPEKEQLDPLMDLVQAIRDFLRHDKTTLETETIIATWIGAEANYSDDHLERLNQFSALIKVRHKVYR